MTAGPLDTSLIDAWIVRALVASSSTLEALDLCASAMCDALGARGIAVFGIDAGVLTCELARADDHAPGVGATVGGGPVHDASARAAETFAGARGMEPAILAVPVLARGVVAAVIAWLDPEVETFGVRLDETSIAGRKLAQLVAEARSDRRRRAAEAALAKSEQRYRLVAEAAGDVLRVWDVASDALEWNAGLEAVLGLPPRALPDLASWLGRVHEGDRARVEEGFRRALDSGADEWSTEYRFEHGDREFRTLADRVRFGRDEHGRAVRVGGAMTDVTDRRRIEARLVLSDRLAAVGTLAAGVAHEINNPLSFVVANLAFGADEIAEALAAPIGLATEQVERLEGVHEALDEARSGLERVRRILSDLRTFARGDGEAHAAAIDVEAALERALRMVEPELREHARLVRRYGKVPPVEADETRLGQIFVALLVNAMQAIEEGTPDENEVLVATRTDERGRVVVEVADSGVGMSRELMARIFDPFFTTKPLGVGTGLGLSICHGLVRSIGGEIFVDSRVGFGSTFRIALPAASSAPAPITTSRLVAAESVAPPSRGGRVLVIDDEASVLTSLHRALSGRHEVVVVQSGRSALDLLSRDRAFDVILTDASMPDVSGDELAAAVSADDPRLAERIVFMTTPFEPGARAAVGAPTQTLEKPFEIGAVRALVEGRVEANRR